MTIREDLVVVLREFARGKSFSKEDAIALAQSNLAATAQAVRQVLKELCESKTPTTREECNILDIAWPVLGVRVCLHSICPEASRDAVTMFVREELRERPHQFSESELRDIEAKETDGSVLMAVKQARVARIQKALELSRSKGALP